MGSCSQDAIVFYFSVEITIQYLHFNLFSLWADISNSSSEFDIITWSSARRSVFRHSFIDIYWGLCPCSFFFPTLLGGFQPFLSFLPLPFLPLILGIK
jgi:hypothetical protein